MSFNRIVDNAVFSLKMACPLKMLVAIILVTKCPIHNLETVCTQKVHTALIRIVEGTIRSLEIAC